MTRRRSNLLPMMRGANPTPEWAPHTFEFSRRIVLVAVAWMLATSSPAGAATLVVDTLADRNAASPAQGTCSLRQAILSANGNQAIDGCAAGEPAPALDTITVPAGLYLLTIPGADEDAGARGDLDLEPDQNVGGDLSIEGAGPGLTLIDANGLDRVFDVPTATPSEPVADLSLRALTVTGGSQAIGGGIRVGFQGSLSLTDVHVTGNSNGISSGGTVNGLRVLVAQNSGDGINTPAILSNLLLTDSTVRQNLGHGIINGRNAVLERSTVNGNFGYGVLTVAGLTPQTTVRNGTIHGNSLNGLHSGGSSAFPTNLTLESSTISGNGGLEIVTDPDAPFVTYRAENTIVEGGCQSTITLLSLGGNLEVPGDSCSFDQPSDQTHVSFPALDLGPLAANGGPTQTRALSAASAALDVGLDTACQPTDQRGAVRTLPCDVGAFEFGAPMMAIVVDSTSDENFSSPLNGNCTLREAVLAANLNIPVDGCTTGYPGLDHIIVPAGSFVRTLAGSGTEAGDLNLEEDVHIQGAGALSTLVDAAGHDRLFSISAGVVATLEDLTLEGGAGGFNGGGIHNQGNLTLISCTLRDNQTTTFLGLPDFGGGIYSGPGARLTLRRSTVSGNQTSINGRGGGVYDAGDFADVLNSTISGNFGGAGGGLATEGQLTLSSVTVANNGAVTGFSSQIFGSGSILYRNTLLWGNCVGSGYLSSGGNVEVGGSTCGLNHLDDQPSVPLAALEIGPLEANGGPTETHSIGATSVARNAAVSVACEATDQRGIGRDTQCDVGSYEFQPPACGLGPELALVLPLLVGLRRRRGTGRKQCSQDLLARADQGWRLR